MNINYRDLVGGALYSPFDSKDYKVSKLLAPINVFPREFCLPVWGNIKNQLNVASCVPHGLGYTGEILEVKETQTYSQFSVGYIYANRRSTDWQGIGMYPREALKTWLDYGNVLYSDFPYNIEYPDIRANFVPIQNDLNLKASRFKISAYARLYNTNEIKNAIMQLGAVPISYSIYESFFSAQTSGIVPIPNLSEKNYGGHMMAIIGWKVINNIEYWILLNSWGLSWGNSGRVYIQTVADFVEAWSVTDSTNQIPPEPDPTYWRVQIGAFTVKLNAERLAEELKTKGYSVYITTVNKIYKCQLGAFSRRDYAEALRDKIKAAGYNAFLVNY